MSATAPAVRAPSALDLPWRVLASRGTSAALGLLLAATTVVAAVVPQGSEALALARDPRAKTLHALAAWGLTDVYASDWFRALLALIAGNVLAVLVGAAMARRSPLRADPPSRAPYTREVITPRPEHAVELTRGVLAARLGLPVLEVAEGARARLVFDVGRWARLGPVLVHAGVMSLVLGAGTYAADATQGVPHAILEVTDPRMGSTGRFDMLAGEPFSFFRNPERYILRDYVPTREGLGPAVRLERQADGERPSEVWVYLNAPPGFDARHRAGEVHIEARALGLAPSPGRGLSGSPAAALMLGGLALVGVGAAVSRRARGRLWAMIDGERITLTGVPERPRDRAFEGELLGNARLLEHLAAED